MIHLRVNANDRMIRCIFVLPMVLMKLKFLLQFLARVMEIKQKTSMFTHCILG